jgi:hypothetical protein
MRPLLGWGDWGTIEEGIQGPSYLARGMGKWGFLGRGRKVNTEEHGRKMKENGRTQVIREMEKGGSLGGQEEKHGRTKGVQ